MSTSTSERYDGATIALHWIVAFGVVLQWLGAHVIDWFPKGPLRVDARSVHIVAGALLTLVLIYRVGWRTRRGVRLKPINLNRWSQGASLVHLLLYSLTMSVLLLGIFNTWVRGDDIFGLFHIPAFGSDDASARHLLANRVVELHRLAANLLLIAAAVHAGAALFHQLILKDGLLRRMLPVGRSIHER